jgi:hypothetical protein
MTEANAWFVAEAVGGDGIAMGSIASSPYTTWIQSGYLNTMGTSNHYPIALNPHGGNVGIGTTSPSTQLHVYDASSHSEIRVATSASGDDKVPALSFNNTAVEWSLGVKADNHLHVRENTASYTSRVTIADGGNIGIGTEAPATILHAKASGDAELRLEAGTNSDARVRFGDATDNDLGYIGFNRNSGYMNFSISNTQGEHMRIDSAGRVLIGHSSAVGGHSELLGIDTDSASGYGIFISGNASSATQTAIRFYDSGASAGVVGSITFATSSTAYNTSSDYRLKENVETMQNGLIRLNKLNPVKFTWKETGKESEGFIAHEVDEIFSDCVHGEKDGDEMQGMDYGRITPLLVKAIQEQQEQIETLKAEVKELREG